jgi:hypothetical protein
MDQATLLLIIKYAILVGTCLNVKPAIPCMAILFDKRCRCHPQELGNPFNFIPNDKDATFPVATGSAHLAIKRFHNKIISLHSMIL